MNHANLLKKYKEDVPAAKSGHMLSNTEISQLFTFLE